MADGDTEEALARCLETLRLWQPRSVGSREVVGQRTGQRRTTPPPAVLPFEPIELPQKTTYVFERSLSKCLVCRGHFSIDLASQTARSANHHCVKVVP